MRKFKKMDLIREDAKFGAAVIRNDAEQNDLDAFYKHRDYWKGKIAAYVAMVRLEGEENPVAGYWEAFRQFENDINHEIKQAEIDGRKCFGM